MSFGFQACVMSHDMISHDSGTADSWQDLPKKQMVVQSDYNIEYPVGA